MTNSTVHDSDIVQLLKDINDKENTGRRSGALDALELWYGNPLVTLTSEQIAMIHPALKEYGRI